MDRNRRPCWAALSHDVPSTPRFLFPPTSLHPNCPSSYRSSSTALVALVAVAMMGPAECFSLLCRTVAEVREKNSANKNNLPLLLLFRVIMSQRNLVFAHERMDTVALCSYMTNTYESVKLDQATQHLADAFHIPAADLDLSARVKVCF